MAYLKTHPHVPNPHWTFLTMQNKNVQNRLLKLNDKVLGFVTDHVLASRLMFNIALILPLVILPMSAGFKLILAVISSNWIQWWALPALQRSSNISDAKRDAKTDADHQALTYLAHQVDSIKALLEKSKAQ